jgi:glycerate kinase
MKIIIAPDSFKGSLRSPEVCRALASGFLRIFPDSEFILVPMADGGEGTVDAAVQAVGGEKVAVNVHGPLMEPVQAEYGVLSGDRAVFEMASASGLELISDSLRNPLKTTTYGTGEILRAILDREIHDITLGIGGSATVDGGAGMMQALGVKLLGRNGQELPAGIGGGDLMEIAEIDISELDARLAECSIRIACDVTNPLLGAFGAAAVFGPQKGASPKAVEVLENNLRHWFEILKSRGLCSDCSVPGDGAAGGLGFALRTLLKGRMASGAGLMIELTGLKNHLRGADLLVTGEGCSDSQTADGKLCAVVAAAAGEAGVPAILISGALRGDIAPLENVFAAVFSIARGPGSLEEAMRNTAANLESAAANIGAVFKLGR